MIFIGMTAEEENVLFVHLTQTNQFVVDLYNFGSRIERSLPMNKERLLKRYGPWYDLSRIQLDLMLN